MAENEIQPVIEDEDEEVVVKSPHMFGRREITTPISKITRANVVQVLNDAIPRHKRNAEEIDYLYNYMRGKQPVLWRKKKIRPEVNNKIVENHAAEIVHFVSGYFLGEPVTYVRRGDKDSSSHEISTLNDYMFFEDKASHDKELATWMAICGVAYRMVLPDRDAAGEIDESPFELDTPDPRSTFVVYNSGFGHHRVMGVRITNPDPSGLSSNVMYSIYTEDRYFEVQNGKVVKDTPHLLGDIPIYEYRLNMTRMGSFEPAIPLLDGINLVQSDRVNGIEQFVQSFLKFKNCDVEDDTIKRLRDLGAIMIKSSGLGMDSDVSIVSQELNQQQTQTLVDYLYDQVLTICGLPTTTKGGTSTSDTGAAVLLRDGWTQCEARARDTELLFKRSERQFLKTVLRLIRETQNFNLSLSEVECKFTRRQHDNLLVKTQALLNLLEAGIHPEPAIAASGVFHDPMDIYLQSEEFLKKWDYKEEIPDVEEEDEDE